MPVSDVTQPSWNDSEDRRATPHVSNDNRNATLNLRLRRALRRLDEWTLTVFNPYFPSNHR